MKERVYIDDQFAPGATQEDIRHAVAAGKRVMIDDGRGTRLPIDRNVLARIDRRNAPKPQNHHGHPN